MHNRLTVMRMSYNFCAIILPKQSLQIMKDKKKFVFH